MSRFFSSNLSSLVPYVPGEQPRDMQYVKLNTNESPFPPSEKAVTAAKEEAERLRLYSDPTCLFLTEKASEIYGVSKENIIFSNGSDEILYFAFEAFCDEKHPAVFADITYGFYPVFAEMARVPYREIPLKEDFSLGIDNYIGINGTVFIANPNAPTGIALSLSDIEKIVSSNRDSVVVIDEAYVDFGAESAVPLTEKYDNLLIVQTFSKSRSMAGARLGFAIGNKDLITDLNTVKYSVNPYNINRMTMAAGIGAFCDEEYTKKNCRIIAENREWLVGELQPLGFEMTDSKSNFIFAKPDKITAQDLYLSLKEKGVLVRWFSKERIRDYVRITVGTKEQLGILVEKTKEILREAEKK